MKYVLVTGASGGMGLSCVNKLVEEGYFVFAIDKEEPESRESVLGIKCDITSIDDIKNAQTIIKEVTDNLYAIVHFAGIYVLDSLVEMEEAKFKRAFDINVNGPFLINKVFIDMLSQGSKIIITTSELALRSSLPFTGIYGITKTTLDEYSYALRMELQLLDINVSVIRPGAVKTKLLNKSTDELDEFCNKTTHYQISSKNFRKVVDRVEAKNIEPAKIASLVNKILKKKKPKYAYNINNNKLLILLDILPRPLRFKIIKHILQK